jgi:hypothetical protein
MVISLTIGLSGLERNYAYQNKLQCIGLVLDSAIAYL